MNDAMDMLAATSRTFFIPIQRLSPKLQEPVASAYLCMRAIDEIEDHPELAPSSKIHLLQTVREILTNDFHTEDIQKLFVPYQDHLPEVTLRLPEWLQLCPASLLPTVVKSVATMAGGMSKWVRDEWRIQTVDDLDDYTFHVAGLVGLLLSEIWNWHGRVQTELHHAVAFGRGLQAVNILRNREEDLARGVDFFPDGWDMDEMFAYARKNLTLADDYMKKIPTGEILDFCKIPWVLAHGTLTALEAGKSKLRREEVLDLVKKVTNQ